MSADDKKQLTLFIDEFLKEDPKKLLLTQMGTTLGDYCGAFVLMKKEGDAPQNGVYYKDFSNCLFTVLTKRFFNAQFEQ